MIGRVSACSATPPHLSSDEHALIVDLDGFEGPLDVLLALARSQKVDLAQISILRLADQFLDFIAQSRALHLELAADYLVMAAWLALLKSRLLLPERPAATPEPSAGEMAAALAARLERLDGVRALARVLEQRYEAGSGRLPRGRSLEEQAPASCEATLHDLVAAYAGQRRKAAPDSVQIAARSVLSLAEARVRITTLLDRTRRAWTDLGRLGEPRADVSRRRSVRASCFAAVLELAREGVAELRQESSFDPVLVRRSVVTQGESTA